jgi:hypothetical protein
MLPEAEEPKTLGSVHIEIRADANIVDAAARHHRRLAPRCQYCGILISFWRSPP